ncbi:HAD family hydrolase [Apibacter muscae]|uniref:HAD family hydrolase n=1 Tax=Apibacter muscae TaxID=2509004 RepID=UPI0011AC7028|nr:HAD family hydrolase [Apibacter muscae]TWP24316.1 HAD family hydrolase [Apibacter muscae]
MIDYSNVKLVVTDMDGTLLHTDYSLNPEFFDLYKQLKELQIQFVVASGRQYDSLASIFNPIKNEIYFISENGGNVIFRDKKIFVGELSQELINKVVDALENLPGTEILLCGVKSAYMVDEKKEFEKFVAPYYPKRKFVSNFREPINDDQIVKIAVFNTKGSEENVYPLVEHLKEDYLVKVSGKNWLDISIKDSNKGKALQIVQRLLGIHKEETMAFGDYLNDLEMIQESKFSFAMENSHPYLKENANYVTKTNDEDGVLCVLKEMIKQRKDATK